MILLIDNYDSFVHNLARYCRQLGQETIVGRNDKLSVALIREMNPQAVILSPGPCGPQQAGCCLDVVRELHHSIPMLGVCLGHQTIAEAFGAKVVRANEPVHGRASLLHHDGTGTFSGLPESFFVGRYHSLVVCADTLPECLNATAHLEDGTIMAIEHREHPVVGWQFHPESVLTEHGYQLLESFLKLANASSGLEVSAQCELGSSTPTKPDWYERAIEFPGI